MCAFQPNERVHVMSGGISVLCIYTRWQQNDCKVNCCCCCLHFMLVAAHECHINVAYGHVIGHCYVRIA